MLDGLDIIILAGGEGTRMLSNQPKTLNQIAGQSFLVHLIETSQSLNPNQILIVQSKKNNLKEWFENNGKNQFSNLIWLTQERSVGTADAVKTALNNLKAQNTLVLYGDVPLISPETLKNLIEQKKRSQSKISLITKQMTDPTGYGRILRDKSKNIIGICEQNDADEKIKKIKEVNTGLMLSNTEVLKKFITEIENNNLCQEYYLTDLVGIANKNKLTVSSINPINDFEVYGVNTRAQLATLERKYQLFQAKNLLNQGVHLIDENRIDIRGNLNCEKNVVIDINCIFIGEVKLAEGVQIGANCIIKDCSIESNSQILPFSHIEGASIGKKNSIGPYARIRPGTITKNQVRIGNFVETKETTLDEGSKANHLSYIGDSKVGKRVNIGAGVITCNYDGKNKHQTVIEDDCFIGSNSQLIAPVKLAKNSLIGAGSTISKNTKENSLNLTRAKLKTKPKK